VHTCSKHEGGRVFLHPGKRNIPAKRPKSARMTSRE
jgi:hypothetical protein